MDCIDWVSVVYWNKTVGSKTEIYIFQLFQCKNPKIYRKMKYLEGSFLYANHFPA